MHKIILALDTAMSGCSAAVLSERGITSETISMPRGQSEELMPMVRRVMEKAGVAFDVLDTVCVTRGPGAFTGLRIGLSAAKSLGSAIGKPVIGLATTDVLAAAFFDRNRLTNETLCVLIETKREDFYVQFFDANGKAESEPMALPAADIAAKCAGRDVIFIGDALARFKTLSNLDADYREGFELPDPSVMLRMAAEGAQGPAEPLYLRGADVTLAGKKTVI